MRSILGLVYLLLAALAVYCLISGIYLAFSASVILGLVSLLFFPVASFSGLIYLLSGADVMAELAKLLGL